MENNFFDFIENIRLEQKNYKELIFSHIFLIYKNKEHYKEKLIINYLEENCLDKPEVLEYLVSYYNDYKDSDKVSFYASEKSKVKGDGVNIFKEAFNFYINYNDYSFLKYFFYKYFNYFSTPNQIEITIKLAELFENIEKYDKAILVIEDLIESDPDYFSNNLDLKSTYNRVLRKNNFQNPDSQLSPKAILYRILHFSSILLLIITLIITGINLLIYFHQRIYIVNGFNKKAIVQLKSGEKKIIMPFDKRLVTLKEGKIEFKIKLGEDEEFTDQFIFSNKFWERFNDKKLNIYNIKGGAFILYEETVYRNEFSKKEDNDTDDPLSLKIYVGETFFKLKKADYNFEEFPETLDLVSGNTRKVSRIGILNIPFNNQIYYFYYYPVDVDNAINYFNAHLDDNIKNESFYSLYYSFCAKNKNYEKTLQKIEPYILDKPVNIPVHRFYQNIYLEIDKNKYTELLNKYENFLKVQPDNSSMLYLYGRLVDDNYKLAKQYYEASISNNKDNPYPWHALAYLYFSSGDFTSAKKYSNKAVSLDSNSELFKSYFDDISFANNEYDQLINDLKSSVKNDPVNYSYLINLIELYLLKNDNLNVKKLIDEYIKNYKEVYKISDTTQIKLSIMLNQNYFQGNFKRMQDLIKKLKNKNEMDYWQYILNIENGNITDAEKYINDNKESYDGFDFLLLFLGWIVKGNNNKADIWLKEAIRYFKEGVKDERRFAGLIEKKNVNNKFLIEELNNLSFYSNYKPIIYLTISRLYPQKRNELINLARKFNYSLRFPHYFINNTIQKL